VNRKTILTCDSPDYHTSTACLHCCKWCTSATTQQPDTIYTGSHSQQYIVGHSLLNKPWVIPKPALQLKLHNWFNW